MIAQTPQPPYYAVIFTSEKIAEDEKYDETSLRMIELAQEQPGYLGYESAGESFGITVSYWKDTASIMEWKQHTEHLYAQKIGKKSWYRKYKVRICYVERSYGWETDSISMPG